MKLYDDFVKTLTFEEKVKMMQEYERIENSDSGELNEESKNIVRRLSVALTRGENVTPTGFMFYFRELHHAICCDFAWKYVNFDLKI
jgi:hypothetical protein